MSPTIGDRDLIQEFTDACRAQGILAGLYFTPPDPYTSTVLGHPEGSAAHEAVQLAQMTELTTRYGELSYIWFDHYCQTAGRLHPQWVCPLNVTYKKLGEIVRKNQPGAVILGQDTKQTGAEGGYAPYPMYYTCDTRLGNSISNCKDSQGGHGKDGNNNASGYGPNGSPSGAFWKSPESDCSIYNGCHPWFASDTAPVQTVDAAIQHWVSHHNCDCYFVILFGPFELIGIWMDRSLSLVEELSTSLTCLRARRASSALARPRPRRISARRWQGATAVGTGGRASLCRLTLRCSSRAIFSKFWA